jgi:hypothetical protein
MKSQPTQSETIADLRQEATTPVLAGAACPEPGLELYPIEQKNGPVGNRAR